MNEYNMNLNSLSLYFLKMQIILLMHSHMLAFNVCDKVMQTVLEVFRSLSKNL